MRVADLLSDDDVLRLAPADKPQLLSVLARHAAARLKLDATAVGRALAEREVLGSTGIGHGLALPHARLERVPSPFGLFAALAKPIEFGAVDDRPVDLVFVLLLPDQVAADQLRCLACVARRLKEPGLADALRATPDPSRLHALLVGG